MCAQLFVELAICLCSALWLAGWGRSSLLSLVSLLAVHSFILLSKLPEDSNNYQGLRWKCGIAGRGGRNSLSGSTAGPQPPALGQVYMTDRAVADELILADLLLPPPPKKSSSVGFWWIVPASRD